MNKFNEIVSRVFKIKIDEVSDSLTSKDIPDWDSMNYLIFIAEIEKEFKVSFGMDEVLGAKSLGDVRSALESKNK